jgi:hypothetical protein
MASTLLHGALARLVRMVSLCVRVHRVTWVLYLISMLNIDIEDVVQPCARVGHTTMSFSRIGYPPAFSASLHLASSSLPRYGR